eukprot:1157647-Pelagomonas_calceolata.AAC.3
MDPFQTSEGTWIQASAVSSNKVIVLAAQRNASCPFWVARRKRAWRVRARRGCLLSKVCLAGPWDPWIFMT